MLCHARHEAAQDSDAAMEYLCKFCCQQVERVTRLAPYPETVEQAQPATIRSIVVNLLLYTPGTSPATNRVKP